MVVGFHYLHDLPAQTRQPQSEPCAQASSPPATPLEPAASWTSCVRHGWRPHNPSSVLPPNEPPNAALHGAAMGPRTCVTYLGSPSPGVWAPSTGQSFWQAGVSALERPPTPLRIESNWEVFEHFATRNHACAATAAELDAEVSLAQRLLRHSSSEHGQGLKVFYMGVGDTILAACPTARADPSKPVMHASLASALLKHPLAAQQQAIRRAIVASNANTLAMWSPDIIGGTRLVLHGRARKAKAPYYTLEPSAHYGHACQQGPLFERLAAFYANILILAGSEAPLWPLATSMQSLVTRIETLRAARAPLQAGASLHAPKSAAH